MLKALLAFFNRKDIRVNYRRKASVRTNASDTRLGFENLEARELLSITCYWTGNHGSGGVANWSYSDINGHTNWRDSLNSNYHEVVPQDGDSLDFNLANPTFKNTNCNFTDGRKFATITFEQTGYSVSGDPGSPINVTGGITCNSGATTTISAGINLSPTTGAVVFDTFGPLTVTGTISGTGGLFFQEGNLFLSGSNTYSGDTTINGGWFKLDGTTATSVLPSTTKVVMNGSSNSNIALLDMGSRSQTVASLTGNQYSRVNMTANNLLTINSNASMTYAGQIYSGPTPSTYGSLKIQGGGTLTLSTPTLTSNSWNSATIDGATLKIDTANESVFGLYSTCTIQNGGTLDLQNHTVSLSTLNLTSGTITAGTIKAQTAYNLDNGTVNAVLADKQNFHAVLTKANTGTVTLGGDAANTYSGRTTVNVGTLVLAKTDSAQAIADGGLTIGDGSNAATVQYTGASTDMIGTGPVSIYKSGVLDLNGKTDDIYTLSFNGGGTLTTGGGKFISKGDFAYCVASDGVAAAISGNLALYGARKFSVEDDASLNSEMNVSAVITDAKDAVSFGLSKDNAGTLTLSGSNSYSGGTTITWGNLIVGNLHALGADGLTVKGGTLDLNGNGITVKSLNGSGGVIDNSSSSGSTVFTVDDASEDNSTFDGKIQDGLYRTVALAKNGPGYLKLTGLNTYSGGTTISGGKISGGSLVINGDGALGMFIVF